MRSPRSCKAWNTSPWQENTRPSQCLSCPQALATISYGIAWLQFPIFCIEQSNSPCDEETTFTKEYLPIASAGGISRVKPS